MGWLLTAFMLQGRVQNLTLSTDLHLFVPILLNFPFTNGAINKPTKLSSPELPGRTFFFDLGRTPLYHPARLSGFIGPPHSEDQKKDVSLYMHWNMSPSLLVAMDSLNRCAKKFGHLLLRLV
jgi:hypothetical protein